MVSLCFATNNISKIYEIELLFENKIKILSLKDINCFEEIPENGLTIEENSFKKAEFIHNKFKISTFSDDSGLIIDELNGEPGVNSAHFSGTRDDFKNINLVLEKLTNKSNRKAHFKTVITYYSNTNILQFTGKLEGEITLQKAGNQGFGYDSIFIPNGEKQTLAEMNVSKKNQISHRAIAINHLKNYLKINHLL